jgi:type I restriction enzyme S subunit
MRTAQQKLEDEAPATAQKIINLEILERLPVPIPPPQEQVVLVDKLSEMLAAAAVQRVAIEQGVKQAAAQRKNILKAAFAGQLVPQDSNDEPASELLANIRTERASNDGSARRRRRKTA